MEKSNTFRISSAIEIETLPVVLLPKWKQWVLDIMRVKPPVFYRQKFDFVLPVPAEKYGIIPRDILKLEDGSAWFVTAVFTSRISVLSVEDAHKPYEERYFRGLVGMIGQNAFAEGSP